MKKQLALLCALVMILGVAAGCTAPQTATIYPPAITAAPPGRTAEHAARSRHTACFTTAKSPP